jgi:hypothetical protein
MYSRSEAEAHEPPGGAGGPGALQTGNRGVVSNGNF